MRTIKRLMAGFLALLIVCALFPAQALAAGGQRCYTISSGNTTVYSNTGLSKKYGTIYGSDEVTVLSVTGSWCRVQYPIGGGRTKTGYIRTGAILLGTGGSDYKATAKITTYRRPGGSSYGYVSKGDTVKVLGTSGSYVQVKYPVSGGYKYAFVTKANAEKYIYGGGSSGSAGTAPSDCYPRYTGSTGSIVTALNSLGIDSSFSFRKQIAIANGITNYTGTASQNTTLLNLLKQGKLKKAGTSSAPSSSGGSSSSGGGLEVHSSYNISVSNKAARNKPHYTNSAGSRSKDNLNAVIDQFMVTSNARYRKNSNGTYCNIFAWDVTSALNAEIPHWIRSGRPVDPGTSGASETTANMMYNWLGRHGDSYGWYTVSAKKAQERANSGYPTVAVWKNPTGKSGHIAVVRPEGSGYYYSDGRGPVIAQAGGSNYDRTNVATGFGTPKMSAILYYTHD